MTRWKTPLILLLSLALIVAGGTLPGIVGRIQDGTASGKVSYGQVSEIHLEFDNSGMTMREKLALLSGMTSTMQVSEGMTTHTSGQIWEIALTTASAYRDAGLIPTELKAGDIAYCVPIMGYWEQYSGSTQIHSNIFWELSIADGYGGDNALTMLIDDRTGTVCTISYQNVTNRRETYERLDVALETLCELALAELGEEFTEFDPDAMVDAAGVTPNTSSYAAADVAWEDPTHGEVRLAFVVSEVGFYTYTY